MRRVLVAGLAVATVDGTLLGISAALGWTVVALVALVAGLLGAVVVAMYTPPPRDADERSTVTLGLPLRDAEATEPDEAGEVGEVEPLRGPERVPASEPAAAAA